MKKRYWFFLTLGCNIFSISAQFDTTETVVLGATHITSPRTLTRIDESGNTVSIISRKQIESLPYQDVASVLNTIAGVDLRQRSAIEYNLMHL